MPLAPQTPLPAPPSGSAPEIKIIVYTGPSMNPLLVAPAMLEVRPYAAGQPPRVGDVLYFHNPEGVGVVHRLVRRTPQGLKTRGDHNRQEDPYWLAPQAIIGQVIGVRSGAARRQVVRGGRLGMWQARWNWFWHLWVAPVLAARWGGLYRRASAWLGPRLPARWQPVELVVRTPQGEVRRLVWRGRVIGEFNAQRGVWNIWHPYRLVAGKWAKPAAEK